MGLADYYQRGALAAAQVLTGFNEGLFRARLDETGVGVAVQSAESPQAQALADLLIRLLARLYPHLTLIGDEPIASNLRDLARRVNPRIELQGDATVGVSVGNLAKPFETTFYAGSQGWDALVSRTHPQAIGASRNPFGAGVAACLAAANVFRRVFLPEWDQQADDALRFSSWECERIDRGAMERHVDVVFRQDVVLAGFGAIGNAALWALARTPLTGVLHVVDAEDVELSNLQRYVLCSREDDGQPKPSVAAAQPTMGLTVMPHCQDLTHFLAHNGYRWDRLILGLDTARDRRSAQASLPRWVANAWTQPGDLGISVHPTFGDEGACVACLYLPDARRRNEDEIIAEALRVPQLQMDVRTLLYDGAPVQRPFLEAIAAATAQPVDALLSFEGRSVRDLYVEGFCGGAVLPLSTVGSPPQELHVPLAHQSALAGVLLAAALTRSALDGDPSITSATRINVLRRLGSEVTHPVRARRDGRCLCDDPIFRTQYNRKYARPLFTKPT